MLAVFYLMNYQINNDDILDVDIRIHEIGEVEKIF